MKRSISVRTLVEYVLRSGDLDFGFVTSTRGVEGTRAHQQVQRSYDKDFRQEVMVSHIFEVDDFYIEVSGRMDGYGIIDDERVVDEIKSTARALDQLKIDDYPLHWAQVQFYGYMMCLEESLKEVTLQLTYISLEDYSTRKFKKKMDFASLEEFVYRVINQYVQWMRFESNLKKLRNSSIDALQFPFSSYRKFQREIAVATYQNIKESRNLFIEASTGIGKTMATLFPAIKALKTLEIDRIFYLTAKTITRTVVEDSIDKLVSEGFQGKAIILTAKDKICFYEEAHCKLEDCMYMKGYYDRLDACIQEILEENFLITREIVTVYGKKYRICPFELSLDLSLYCDIIVGDYNYVFDPRVRLKRFFDESDEKITLLVDESHNLINRGREMYSAVLEKQDFLDFRRQVKGEFPILGKKIAKVNKAFLALKKEMPEEVDFYTLDESPEKLYDKVHELNTYLEGWLNDYPKHKLYEDILNFYFEVLAYIRIGDLSFEGSLFYFQKINKNNYKAKLFNIDPSVHLKNIPRHSAVFFSATLSPIDYYREMLGGSNNDLVYKFPSPFDKKNRLFLYSNEVSTRYKDRGRNISLICEYVNRYINNNLGNSIVFFPSYAFLDQVYQHYVQVYDEQVYCQSRGMLEVEREDFINLFRENQDITAFVVAGGIFSEGIDLKGTALNGAILVGIALPGFGLENNIIKGYFDEQGHRGYDYAFRYPTIIKIMQAAGRVIRSHNDRGTILLIGDRFSNSYYRQLLPKDWGHETIHLNTLKGKLDKFWKTTE